MTTATPQQHLITYCINPDSDFHNDLSAVSNFVSLMKHKCYTLLYWKSPKLLRDCITLEKKNHLVIWKNYVLDILEIQAYLLRDHIPMFKCILKLQTSHFYTWPFTKDKSRVCCITYSKISKVKHVKQDIMLLLTTAPEGESIIATGVYLYFTQFQYKHRITSERLQEENDTNFYTLSFSSLSFTQTAV